MEFLSTLADKSHIALMSNRQTGKAGAEKSKLIIGSGKKLEFDENMTSGDSVEALDKGSFFYRNIFKLMERNKNNEYRNYIGYLGDVIRKNNGSVCFLGNSDAAEANRSSMLVAMDSSGIIDAVEVNKVLVEDEMFPFGRRTDYNRLAELYKQYLPASSFMVIDTGDMERLEKSKSSMPKYDFQSARKEVLEDIDSFIEELVGTGGFETIIFISTYPSRSEAEKNNRLTPIIVYEAEESGLLYSINTRRQGIVLNTDIADFVINKLGYSNFSNIKEISKEAPFDFLEADNEKITRVSRLRTPVLTAYSMLVIAALTVLFIIAVLFENKKRAIIKRIGSILACIILIFPIAFLYMPSSLSGDDPVSFFLYSAACAVLVSVILQLLLKDVLKMAFYSSMLLFAGLTVDILLGSPFMKQSVLGYDPEIGARFYGIGNEYAGMYMGSSLIVAGSFLELAGKSFSRSISILYSIFCTLLLGLTFFGANFGGAVAGASGYILAYFLVYGIKFNKRNISAGILIIVAAAAFLISIDSLGLGSQSHMGGLVEDAGANGAGVITSTIARKIAMNFRLIRYTIWTKVLLTIIAIIAFMLFRPAKILQMIFENNKYMKCSWMGIAASSIIGFAVNDSGIVFAATAMISVAFTMLLLCMGERKEKSDGLQNTG
jgi:hypothetical protein